MSFLLLHTGCSGHDGVACILFAAIEFPTVLVQPGTGAWLQAVERLRTRRD